MKDSDVTSKPERNESGAVIKEVAPADQVLPGDRVTVDPTMADEEVVPPARQAADGEISDEDDDDIVPGPLDEADEDEEEEDDDTPSDSVPGTDEAPDVDYGDPDSPAKVPMKDPLIVDE